MTFRRSRKIEILEKQLQRSCSNILHKISPGLPPPHLSLFPHHVCGDQGTDFMSLFMTSNFSVSAASWSMSICTILLSPSILLQETINPVNHIKLFFCVSPQGIELKVCGYHLYLWSHLSGSENFFVKKKILTVLSLKLLQTFCSRVRNTAPNAMVPRPSAPLSCFQLLGNCQIVMGISVPDSASALVPLLIL